MGKKFRDKKKKRANGSNSQAGQRSRSTGNYVELVRENAGFEKYYKAQHIVPLEEWDAFMACLKEDLPAAFRLTGSKSQSYALLSIMKKKFFEPAKKAGNDLTPPNSSEEAVKPLKPMCLPWYPDGLAWQLNLTRKDIRRCEAYWRLHQFLISETDTGNISRQEAVSMIPPVLLDVQPHHKVLDMCAAPGSKTSQIMEIMHSRASDSSGLIPSGIVVANDADNKRCYMLTHQAKRIQSPTLIITNHDAAFMPNIMHTRPDASVGPMKFDRILCDVPCSGDGTLRKNFDVWTKWNSVNGANLHGLQLRIARRGMEMLCVGGRMVYSTCSLNPLENESVINRLLSEAQGSVVLKEVTDQLPGLKVVPGLHTWTVMTKELDVIGSPEEIPPKNINHFHPKVFPPSADVAEERKLSRCVRVLPHHQNTGGFFVAVLEKISLWPGEKVYKPAVPEKDDNGKGKSQTDTGEGLSNNAPPKTELTQRIKPPPKKRPRGFNEEPFFYLENANEELRNIFDFFGAEKSTKCITHDLLLSRTSDGTGRNIYFTNPLVKDVIHKNQERMKLINAGVKVFVRCDNKGSTRKYRLAQDGIYCLAPICTKRKVRVAKEDLVKLLINDDTDEPPQIYGMSKQTRDQCADLENGSAMFVYIGNINDDLEKEHKDSDKEYSLSESVSDFPDRLNDKEKNSTGSDTSLLQSENGHQREADCFTVTLVGWKGRNSLRCYVSRVERLHFLRVIGSDTSAFEKNKFEETRDVDISCTKLDITESSSSQTPCEVSDLHMKSPEPPEDLSELENDGSTSHVSSKNNGEGINSDATESSTVPKQDDSEIVNNKIFKEGKVEGS